MGAQTTAPEPAVRREVPSAGANSTRLAGQRLVLARGVWLAVAALTIALYIAGVWVWIGQVRGPCPPGMCVHGRVPLAVLRQFTAFHLSVRFYGWYNLWMNVLFAVGFAAMAALLFWRRSHDPLALFVALALLVFGVGSFESGFLAAGLPSVSPGWRLPVNVIGFAGHVAFGVFICIFPDGRFMPRWTRLALVLFTLWLLPSRFFPGSPLDFTTWPAVAYLGGWAVILGLMGGAQVYRYRRISTPAQQRQTRWVVFGFVAAGIGYLAGQLVVYFLAPSPLTSPQAVLGNLAGYTLAYASILLIPVCIGIAMLRDHLFDIDVIINRALVYVLLTGTLALVYLVSVLVAQVVVQAVWGRQPLPSVVVVASTLLIAALFQPLRRGLQDGIDRRFYRHKYDAARTVEAFGATLRSELDIAQLSEKLVVVVEETMQPSQATLWLVRRPPQDELASGQHWDARTAEAVRPPKPVPLPGLFAVPDDSTL